MNRTTPFEQPVAGAIWSACGHQRGIAFVHNRAQMFLAQVEEGPGQADKG